MLTELSPSGLLCVKHHQSLDIFFEFKKCFFIFLRFVAGGGNTITPPATSAPPGRLASGSPPGAAAAGARSRGGEASAASGLQADPKPPLLGSPPQGGSRQE